MDAITELCSTCRSFLCSAAPIEEQETLVPTGQSLEAFRQAAEKGCYICNQIWNRDPDHACAFSQLSAEDWTPLSYSFSSSNVSSEITVVVRYHDMTHLQPDEVDYNATLIFHLYPLNGESSRVFSKRARSRLCTDESSSRFFPTITRIEPMTSSPEALNAAYSWFKECQSQQDHCRIPVSQNAQWYPTRLVDIGASNSDTWRLHIVAEDGALPPSTPYMTLSYRWPANPTLVLLSSNLQSLPGRPVD